MDGNAIFFNENVSLARMKVMAFGQVKLLRYQPNLMFCIVHDLWSISIYPRSVYWTMREVQSAYFITSPFPLAPNLLPIILISIPSLYTKPVHIRMPRNPETPTGEKMHRQRHSHGSR